jgi:hypothetical protein
MTIGVYVRTFHLDYLNDAGENVPLSYPESGSTPAL